MSDDGANAITIIVFIGSVFSPYYVWAKKRDPLDHVAVNVALYGKPSRWAMTERGRADAHQMADAYMVGRSGIRDEGGAVRVTIDERCAPFPRRLKGEVVMHPHAISTTGYTIDRAGDHLWRPVAPASPIEVRLTEPNLSWRGTGYFDMNWGSCPLESTFSHWDWMRVDLGEGRSAIFYETEELTGGGKTLALATDRDGSAHSVAPPPRQRLPKTLWRVDRAGWSDGEGASVRRTLEDTPFYVRTELDTDVFGARHTAIQESLSLRKFNTPVVRAMLPFRMPRIVRKA